MLVRVRHLLTRSVTLRTFGVVVALAGLAKVAGLIKEMAVASSFGTGAALDAYLFVFNILSAPASMWFSTISAVLVPHLIAWERRSPHEAARFRSQFLVFAMAAGIVVGLLGWSGLYAYVVTGVSGLDAVAGRHAIDALSWLWLMVPLLFVAQYGASCLMARNLHANSLYEGAPAVVILAAVLLFPATVRTLAIATVAGFALQLGATLVSLSRCSSLQAPTVRFRSLAWKGFWPAFYVMAGVQFLQSASSIIDQVIAARLPTGSLSQFSYALRAQGVLLTLLALAVPRVLLPALAAMSHAAPEELRRFVRRWALLLGAVGGTSAAIVALLSGSIVRLLFERGSFSPADTDAVSMLLAVMIWQLPFYLLAMLYSQRQIATGNYASLVWMAGGTITIKLTLGLALVWQFGLVGLTASIPIVAAFQVGTLLYATSRSERMG